MPANPTPEEWAMYGEYVAWETWTDSVARFNHWLMRPFPNREVCQAHRKVCQFLKAQRKLTEQKRLPES